VHLTKWIISQHHPVMLCIQNTVDQSLKMYQCSSQCNCGTFI